MIPVQLEENGPITEIDPSLLERRDTTVEDSREIAKATEYWLGDRCVHRSVHVHLKQGLDSSLIQGAFGG